MEILSSVMLRNRNGKSICHELVYTHTQSPRQKQQWQQTIREVKKTTKGRVSSTIRHTVRHKSLKNSVICAIMVQAGSRKSLHSLESSSTD
uniref:Uncharacterized protein n=1 Tax=Pygocentrus nattereri TaxID=42514 RepID=A0AAR2L9Y4_PYGNA